MGAAPPPLPPDTEAMEAALRAEALMLRLLCGPTLTLPRRPRGRGRAESRLPPPVCADVEAMYPPWLLLVLPRCTTDRGSSTIH